MFLGARRFRSWAAARAPHWGDANEIVEHMIEIGWEQRVFPAAKIAHVVDALSAEGVAPNDALRGTDITLEQLRSPSILVSVNQVIECYRNAHPVGARSAFRLPDRPEHASRALRHVRIRHPQQHEFSRNHAFRRALSSARHAACQAAILRGAGRRGLDDRPAAASRDRRAPLSLHRRNAVRRSRLAATRRDGGDVSSHRGFMSPTSATRRLTTMRRRSAVRSRSGQPANCFQFDSAWLDGTPPLGNEIAYSTVLALCDDLHDQLRNRLGLAGKVRSLLLANLGRHASSRRRRRPSGYSGPDAEAQTAGRTHLVPRHPRSVARRSRDQISARYEDDDRRHRPALGFSETANFRHAFRRWKQTSPLEYRRPHVRGATRRTGQD